jgi:hypothetical protein
VASSYIAAFAGRTDVYGVDTAGGWRPRRSPLTPFVVTEAFSNLSPITFYFLPPGDMTHVAGVDFDTEDGFEQAIRMGCGMWDDGVSAYVETSRRGAHLWVVMDGRLHARILRSALRAYLQAVGLPANDEKIELRPGSDGLSDHTDAIGHSLRAPMMPHPLTGVAATLLDPRTGQPLGDTVAEVMEAIQRAPATTIIAAAERYRPPEPPQHRPSTTSSAGRIADFNASIGVSQILQAAGAGWARPGGHGRCPYHPDSNPSMSVSHDDRRAWCFSRSCAVNRDDKGMDAWDLARLSHQRAT